MHRGLIPVSSLTSCYHRSKAMAYDAFLDSNIMVDEKSFNITGIIDWEGAHAQRTDLSLQLFDSLAAHY